MDRFNPARGMMKPLLGGGGFNPLAAGNKRYGEMQRSAPNVGPVGNKAGYVERDNRYRAYEQALRNRSLRS